VLQRTSIALMLGRLRMDEDTARKYYDTLAKMSSSAMAKR